MTNIYVSSYFVASTSTPTKQLKSDRKSSDWTQFAVTQMQLALVKQQDLIILFLQVVEIWFRQTESFEIQSTWANGIYLMERKQ